MMLQLHLLMAVGHVVASAVVAAATIVVAAAFVASVVVAAMYAANLVGFATSFDVDVDAINPNAVVLGVFNVIAKPNVTDEKGLVMLLPFFRSCIWLL
jgi:hypothetical protein